MGSTVSAGRSASRRSPRRLATAGMQVTIRLPGGALVTARVSEHLAQVDPDGKRMRV
jgi:hypothetical protein